MVVADPRLYERLGVNPDSDLNEIKRAYRRQALALHPDKVPGNQIEV